MPHYDPPRSAALPSAETFVPSIGVTASPGATSTAVDMGLRVQPSSLSMTSGGDSRGAARRPEPGRWTTPARSSCPVDLPAGASRSRHLQSRSNDWAMSSSPTRHRPLPTTKDQCKNGGWRNYGTGFKNQGDCVSFVATDGRNLPPLGLRLRKVVPDGHGRSIRLALCVLVSGGCYGSTEPASNIGDGQRDHRERQRPPARPAASSSSTAQADRPFDDALRPRTVAGSARQAGTSRATRRAGDRTCWSERTLVHALRSAAERCSSPRLTRITRLATATPRRPPRSPSEETPRPAVAASAAVQPRPINAATWCDTLSKVSCPALIAGARAKR